MTWAKNIIHWRDEDYLNISVVFTWHLPKARILCAWNQQAGIRVQAGGPAVDLMPDYLADVAECGGQMFPLPLSRHNPDATFTTRGCIRKCLFCAVPKIEGEFRELDDWIPAPIVCDNNLLAASRKHFNHVIDRLKPFDNVDFNQGLDVQLLKDWHLDRLRELKNVRIRFAWDWVNMESLVMDAIDRTLAAGIPKSRINVYALIGHKDTPTDALYRLQTLKAKGITPNPMRYQPLDTLVKDSHVARGWADPKNSKGHRIKTTDLRSIPRMMRYWSRQNWLSKVPYADFVG